MIIDERETSAAAYAIVKEGVFARRNGGRCPYAGNTIRHFLHSQGWLTEDLRIALMKADSKYEADQAAQGNGLAHLPRVVRA